MSGIARNLVLMLADAVCIALSWFVSVLFYYACGGSYEPKFYLQMWPVTVAFVTINAFFRLYHGNAFSPAAPVSPPEELRRLTGSSFLVHLGLIAALAFAYQTTEGYSRAVILIAGGLTAVLAQPFRDAVRGLLKRFNAGQIPVKVSGSSAGRMRRIFERDAYLGFRPVPEGADADVAVVCGATLRETDATSLETMFDAYTHVIFFPESTFLPVGGARTVTVDGRGGIGFVNRRRMQLLRIEKWALDKGLSVLAFVALLPFFLILPLLVKLTSRGPVFYRQHRLGRDGVPIRVWKFRSMYADADARLETLLASDPSKRIEWERNFKLSNDPRITPFGRFLRKTSLDELPQLFNVFAGEMSLVGPRPIVEREIAYYGGDYAAFASVAPGVTGLWQVSGRSDTDYARRVALDVHYVLNWSPWMDFWILRKTIGAVLFMRGAR